MNNRFDRTIINTRERPLSSDINTAQSQLDRSLREVLKSLFTARSGSGASTLSGNPPSGFIGDAFKVRESAVPGLSVVLSKGNGFQYLPGDVPSPVTSAPAGVDDLCDYKPLALLAEASIVGITAGPAAGSDRYDIIEVRMNRVVGNPLSRDVLDPGTGVFVPTSVNKTLAFTQDGSVGVVSSPASSTAAISYKQGVAAGLGAAVEPAVTTGYVKIATIFSNNGNMTTSITKRNIIDARVPLCPDGLQQFACRFSATATPATPPSAVFQDLPAGVEVLVHKTIDVANELLTVWFIGGAVPVRGHASVDVLASGGATQFYPAQIADLVVGLLDPGLVSLLANAGTTSNAQTFAEGTPYFMVALELMTQAGGATSAPPDPLTVDLHGVLKRY